MAIRDIRTMGDPCLYNIADEVELAQIKTPLVQQIITDLIDTLKSTDGVGIAAPQIGIPLRIIIVNINDHAAELMHCKPIYFQAHINPNIIESSENMAERLESCLSLPGLVGLVPRSKSIVCESYNCFGEKIKFSADHYIARVIQHEMDHLNGKLYWSRVNDLSQFGFEEHLLSS